MKFTIKDMCIISIFTACTALGAFLTIPIGPVPITLQSFFVILSGIVLGSKLGTSSQLLYVLMGLLGFPIFSNFSGGLQYVFQPSFGFILGFILCSFVVGKLSYLKKQGKSFKYLILICTIGTLCIYLIGMPYMYFILKYIMSIDLNFDLFIQNMILPFLPGDMIKIMLVSFVSSKIQYVFKYI